jgi:hypothetical protein
VTAPKPAANRTCRTCQRPVIGARTEARNRWIALDPDPDAKGNQAAFQDSDGTWKTRQLAKDDKPWDWETVFMPHVATCKPQEAAVVPIKPLPQNVTPITDARSLRSGKRNQGK